MGELDNFGATSEQVDLRQNEDAILKSARACLKAFRVLTTGKKSYSPPRLYYLSSLRPEPLHVKPMGLSRSAFIHQSLSSLKLTHSHSSSQQIHRTLLQPLNARDLLSRRDFVPNLIPRLRLATKLSCSINHRSSRINTDRLVE